MSSTGIWKDLDQINRFFEFLEPFWQIPDVILISNELVDNKGRSRRQESLMTHHLKNEILSRMKMFDPENNQIKHIMHLLHSHRNFGEKESEHPSLITTIYRCIFLRLSIHAEEKPGSKRMDSIKIWALRLLHITRFILYWSEMWRVDPHRHQGYQQKFRHYFGYTVYFLSYMISHHPKVTIFESLCHLIM